MAWQVQAAARRAGHPDHREISRSESKPFATGDHRPVTHAIAQPPGPRPNFYEVRNPMKAYSFLARLGRRAARSRAAVSSPPPRHGDHHRPGPVGALGADRFLRAELHRRRRIRAPPTSPTRRPPRPSPPACDADPFFNDILRQIIIGPSVTEKQSVMWGGTNSLVPTMFGRDMVALQRLRRQPDLEQHDELCRPSTRTTTACPTTARRVNWITGRSLCSTFAGGRRPVAGQHGVLHRFFVSPLGTDGTDLYRDDRRHFGRNATQLADYGRVTVTDSSVTWMAVPTLDFNNYPNSGSQLSRPRHGYHLSRHQQRLPRVGHAGPQRTRTTRCA